LANDGAQLLGGTIAAYIAGRVMNRFGRRIGLSLGYVAGIAGAAVIAGNFTLFLGDMFLLGAARATSDQSRYAAADVSPAPMHSRGEHHHVCRDDRGSSGAGHYADRRAGGRSVPAFKARPISSWARHR